MIKLADEIRAMYIKPHYTFEEVIEVIRKHVKATYKDVGKCDFSSFPGFNVSFSDDVPKMKWECGMDAHCLIIPDGSVIFEKRKINEWFKEQGFVWDSPYEGWKIKF